MTRLLLASLALATTLAAQAQPCPDKNVMYWQAFPPGGESDLSARHQQIVLKKKCAAIDTVILLTPANPLLDAPADLKIADAFAKAKTVIHFGERTDATALAATWHVPSTHYLESWSDARTVNGVYTVVQPMILPLYSDCASELEVLSALLADDGKLVTGQNPASSEQAAEAVLRLLK